MNLLWTLKTKHSSPSRNSPCFCFTYSLSHTYTHTHSLSLSLSLYIYIYIYINACVQITEISFGLDHESNYYACNRIITLLLIIQGFFFFIFTVIFTTFQPICPPAFFMCFWSNSVAYMELRTTPLF